MSREVRRVPADWQHPKGADGRYIPLFDGSFSKSAADWDEEAAQWAKGFKRDYPEGWEAKDSDDTETFEEWDGERPVESTYMPEWPEEERTHLQMYESTTEGTPVSPVMETPEELAHWLADNAASACGGMTATYGQWLATIQVGFAPTMMFSPKTGLISGVEASLPPKDKE